MTDFNMPPGVSARDIPGQDEAIDEITSLRAEVEAKQARIDALMLEHCPDEMTQEQTDNWKAHQHLAPLYEVDARRTASAKGKV